MHKLQLEEMENGLNNVWEAIGADVLEMFGSDTISKADVIEMVLDANRMDAHGGLDADALLFWNGLNSATQKRVAKSAFTYKRYGY